MPELTVLPQAGLLASLSPFPYPCSGLIHLPQTDKTTAQRVFSTRPSFRRGLWTQGGLGPPETLNCTHLSSSHISATGSWSSRAVKNQLHSYPGPLSSSHPTANHSSSHFRICSLLPTPGTLPGPASSLHLCPSPGAPSQISCLLLLLPSLFPLQQPEGDCEHLSPVMSGSKAQNPPRLPPHSKQKPKYFRS